MAKTQQELDDEERQRNAARSMWDMFSGGSWMWLIAIVIGLYFFGRSEWGQELIGKVFGDDAQKKVKELMEKSDGTISDLWTKVKAMFGSDEAKDQLVDQATTAAQACELLTQAECTPELAAILAPSDAEWAANKPLLKKADGHYGIDDTVMYNILTKKPALAGKLFEQIGKNATPGAPLDAKAQEYLGYVRAIIADPVRMHALLKNTETVKMLGHIAAGYVPMMNEGTLTSMIPTLGLLPDGSVNPQLQTMLITALTPNAQGNLPSASAALSTMPKEMFIDTALYVLKAMDPNAKENNAVKKAGIIMLQQNEAQTRALLGTLGQQGAGALLDAVQSGNLKNIEKVLLDRRYEGAVHQFITTINPTTIPAGEVKHNLMTLRQLTPQAWDAVVNIQANGVSPLALAYNFTGPVGRLRNVLLDPGQRYNIFRAGSDNLATIAASMKMPAATQGNIDQLLAFGKAIGDNAANQQDTPRTNKVMDALLEMVVHHNKGPLTQLDPNQVATFVRINGVAVGKLLAKLDLSKVPAEQRAELEVFKKHWGKLVLNNGELDTAQSNGFVELLADPVAVKYLLDKMKSNDKSTHWEWTSRAVLMHEGGTISENRDSIIDLMKAMGTIAPSATPARPSAPRSPILGLFS